MITKLEKILNDVGTVEDVYVFEETFFITHVSGSCVSESDVVSLLNIVESEGFDVNRFEYGFYSHPINDEVYGIYLKVIN